MQVLPSIYVAPSPLGGRGVFTSEDIPEGTPIEISPVIVLPHKDVPHIHATKLHDYYFTWGNKDQKCAIVLGYGSIYNHSYHPNAQYVPDYQGQTLDFYALTDIKAGEEITVNYSGNPEGERMVWFEVREETQSAI
jgi:SET domain-containing protein